MRIIGITGTNGAGKGTIVDYVVNKYGFTHYSVRAYLTGIINERALPLNRDSMVAVANELRAAHSPSYIVEALYDLAVTDSKAELAAGHNLPNGSNFEGGGLAGDCIIESIRTAGEIDALERKGSFYLFAVDAPSEMRYDRIVNRGSSTDQVSYKTFVSNEQREMESDDPNKQNLSVCIARATHTFINDSSFEALYERLDQTLKNLS